MAKLPDCRFWWRNTDEDCCNCLSEDEHRERCEGDDVDDESRGGDE